MPTYTADSIIKDQSMLEDDRRPYEDQKQLCVQMALPSRSDQWDLFGTDEGKSGKSKKIYDSTAIKSANIWATGIIGHYMPKEINWFTESMPNKKFRDNKKIRAFLQDTDEHLRYVLNACNYYESKLTTISDSGVIGDSFIYIDNDGTSGKLITMAPHPREFYLRRDYWGRVTRIHHKFVQTLQQIAGEFGLNALTEEQRITLKENPGQKTEIIHAIIKNTDYNPDKVGTKNMLWLHYYVNLNGKKTMKVSGSETLNPIPWSLHRPTQEIYGRGIVSSMLTEILIANFAGKDLMVASQTAARPSMLMPSALKNNLDLRAGAVNFVNHRDTQGLKMGDMIARLTDSSGYPFGQDMLSRWQGLIEDRFGVPLFLAMNANDNPNRTAYEIRQRQAERAALMSPFLGTLGSTTDMELDRVYSLELEAGRAPEIPGELLEAEDRRIDIEYIGPLSQLLKQYYETGNLLTTIANIQAVLSVDQNAAVVFDGEELMRKILNSGNAPEDIILSKDDVAEIKAIAAQQQEQEKQQQMMLEAAKAAPGISGKVDQSSLMNQMAGANA